MTPAYIALGSNLGQPYRQLGQAVASLELLPDTLLERVSSVYRSSAVGPGLQPDYLNAVLLLTTNLSAIELLDALQHIENAQGRVRDIRWGPRTLDLDLLLYGDQTITSARLTVPHPQMQQRKFVLYPLREISDANLVMPNGSDLDTLLRQCPEHELVRTEYQLWPHDDPQGEY
jgi:2-amino-4-hydroxy-6-hydroxymethyldihydropteridine diphosphokinase